MSGGEKRAHERNAKSFYIWAAGGGEKKKYTSHSFSWLDLFKGHALVVMAETQQESVTATVREEEEDEEEEKDEEEKGGGGGRCDGVWICWIWVNAFSPTTWRRKECGGRSRGESLQQRRTE